MSGLSSSKRIMIFADQSPNYRYGLGQNSNSYAATLLWMVGVDVNSYLAAATPSSVSGMTATSAEAEFGESWSIDFLDPFPGADRNILLDGYGDLLLNPVVNFIDINLTSGNDIFRTGHGDDRIFGNAGADTIEAHGGDDTLSGGSGSDQLFGGDGFDFADYSGGGEQAQNQPAQGIRAAFSINSDNALVGTVTDSWGATDQLNGIEFLIATNSDDRLRIIGDADDVFWSSNQQLEATGGGNSALGDVLDLSDLLTSSGVDVVWAADGVIEVRQSGTFGTITVDDFENVIGSAGADRISGNSQANGINGNTGADELFGFGGDDFIFFDAEDTVVNGGAGRDVGCALTGDPITADLVAMAMEAAWGIVAAEGFHRKGFCGLDIPSTVEHQLCKGSICRGYVPCISAEWR
jgi:Ca2+-binding RTX toxin-like protein